MNLVQIIYDRRAASDPSVFDPSDDEVSDFESSPIESDRFRLG